MKNIRRIGYIVLIVIVVVLSLTIYTNASRDDEKELKDKTFSQIKYMEGKIANLFNSMNNIEVRNYSVVTSEMSKATTEKAKSKNEGSEGQQGGGATSSGGSSSGEQGESTEDSSEGPTNGKEEKQKKFELQAKGVLTKTEDINWDIIKNEVENLYTSLPNITMDLYQFNINQEDILGFNTQYDKLTNVIKDDKKQETLTELANLYQYFPKFLKGSDQEELYTTIIETKANIFKAYAKLETENWQEMTNDIKSAIDIYSKLLTNTEVDARKQYDISKGYVMINELQNAVNLKDTAVFLIKYKNLLEQFNNM